MVSSNLESINVLDNRFLDGRNGYSLSLLLLNQPLKRETLIDLFVKSSNVVCADGGANRLFDAFDDETERKSYLPGFIKGDLDSIRPEVRAYYTEKGVIVEELQDQDYNDMEKCLQFMLDTVQSDFKDKIVVYGAFGGRMDQTLSSLNSAMKFGMQQIRTDIVLMDENSLMLLLKPGESKLILSERYESKIGCGLIPLGTAKATLCTKGLKWNIGDYDATPQTYDTLRFGDFISTSNEVVAECVQVVTQDPIFWCTSRSN